MAQEQGDWQGESDWVEEDKESSDEHSDDDDVETNDLETNDRQPVKFFTHELSCSGRLHRLLIQNPTSRIYSAVFDLTAKVSICLLYVIRVCLDNPQHYACEGHPCSANDTNEPSGSVFTSTNINWYVLGWVHRPLVLWIVQVVICVLTAGKALLYVGIATKATKCDQILSKTFIMEMLFSLPLIATAFYPVMLRNLFVPLFLNCWLAKSALRRLMNDLHLSKQKFQTLSVTLNQQICFVAVTIVCIIFTTICGIQHIQRGSADKPLTMFEAVYFAIVTLSTVGYGDISPDIWLGQVFMLLMICVAFAFVPKQLEEISSTWTQRKKTGGDYGKNQANKGKHVVVCASSFSADMLMNFLNEFYEHPKLQEHTVILMSSEELDSSMLFILKDPKWAHRVVYIKGSPLKDIDLKRCRINNAESVFFLGDKTCADQNKSDQHTILRSWAVKDFAPGCRQHVQLFKATNKQHVRFAEHVVCEDEFKFALLANNCLYPGLSTLVTLILYTSRGNEGHSAKEAWQQVYGRHSGNEIYHIQLSNSVFFKRYEGRSFVQASAEVHDKLGVCLLAVLDSSHGDLRLKLNPGPDYILKGGDYCFYMSQTKEEYSEVTMVLDVERPNSPLASPRPDGSMFRYHNVLWKGTDSAEDRPLPDQSADKVWKNRDETAPRLSRLFGDIWQDNIMAGPLPNSMSLGTKRIICHLHSQPRPLCCTAWGEDCEHCSFKNAGDPRWQRQLMVVWVEECSPAVYSFIVPLRASYLALGSLSPVVLLVTQRPDSLFLETIAHFPLVFWMTGTIDNLDDLLRAGIHKASHLVISNMAATADSGTDHRLEDAETVVMVQKITRLFPSVKIITEMKEDSNMRFMHFQANDTYIQQISKLEKQLKEKAVNLPYMFRPPFAAGQVFSSAMLDRLLYQTCVKGYLIYFVRLLLGIDAQKRSGHLCSVHVSRSTVTRFPTYGDLYQSLCSDTGQIPIALYRTKKRPGFDSDMEQALLWGNNNALSIQKGRPSIGGAVFQKVEDYGNVAAFINSRLDHLQLGADHPYVITQSARTLSYVIVNPSPKRKLKRGDMIYVLQPSSMLATPFKPRCRGAHRHPTWDSQHRRSSIHLNTAMFEPRASGDGRRRSSAATCLRPPSPLAERSRRQSEDPPQTEHQQPSSPDPGEQQDAQTEEEKPRRRSSSKIRWDLEESGPTPAPVPEDDGNVVEEVEGCTGKPESTSL